MLERHLHRRPTVEDQLPGEQVVADTAEGVEVDAVPDLLRERQLGSHVRGGAGNHVLLRELELVRAHLDVGLGFHQAEVQDLHEIDLGAEAAEEDVGGLDVPMHQAMRVGVLEAQARLRQRVDHAAGLERTVLLHQRLEVLTFEQLHHVVEGAVLAHAEIVELDGVRRAQHAGRLRFALEAPDGGLGVLPQAVRGHQLDGGWARQHLMLAEPDLAHPAGAELLHQLIGAEGARFRELHAQPVDDVRDGEGAEGGDEGRQEDEGDVLHRPSQPRAEPEREGQRGIASRRGRDAYPGPRRDGRREEHEEERQDRHPQAFGLGAAVEPRLEERDAEAGREFEGQPDPQDDAVSGGAPRVEIEDEANGGVDAAVDVGDEELLVLEARGIEAEGDVSKGGRQEDHPAHQGGDRSQAARGLLLDLRAEAAHGAPRVRTRPVLRLHEGLGEGGRRHRRDNPPSPGPWQAPRRGRARDYGLKAASVLRVTFMFFVALASLSMGCGDDRPIREWSPDDHGQPQAGVEDGRTAPDGTPANFDEASAVASLYRVRCASCHGETGRGDGMGIPPGAQVRDFTDPEWQGSVTDEEIAVVIAQGRGMMPRFDDSINERGINGLVAHIRGFAGE